jgi:hypothetical protein
VPDTPLIAIEISFMAAPLTKRQTDRHIDSVKTTKIINKLQNHILEGEEMAPSAVTAGLGLLKKTMGDQQTIEATTTIEGKVTISVGLGS